MEAKTTINSTAVTLTGISPLPIYQDGPYNFNNPTTNQQAGPQISAHLPMPIQFYQKVFNCSKLPLFHSPYNLLWALESMIPVGYFLLQAFCICVLIKTSPILLDYSEHYFSACFW